MTLVTTLELQGTIGERKFRNEGEISSFSLLLLGGGGGGGGNVTLDDLVGLWIDDWGVHVVSIVPSFF